MTGLKTDLGKKIAINRIYKSSPDYTVPSQFKVGVGTTAAATTNTDVENAIPIGNGTSLDDGSNTLTGSNGGDNSTDNTTTFKPGAGQTDNTAQNLIANSSSSTKTWAISDLSVAGTNATANQYTSIWLYIIDGSALGKFLSSGTAIEIKLGSDSSNYYSKTFEASSLQTGWNWLQLGVLNTNTETGTVGSPIDYFEIEITTNNATDTFAAGDVVYDLLRQWENTDLLKNFKSVTLDEVNFEVEVVCELLSTEAVGFDLSELGNFNTDTTPKLDSRIVFPAESKSSGDEFKFTVTDGIQ